MRMKPYLLLAVVAILYLATWSARGVGKDTKTSAKIWEYKCVEVGDRPLPGRAASDEVLDRLGSDGWELVSVVPEVHGLTYLAYLKRSK